uniref:Uncharacterized protein n=1 Tax=Haptolina ericina TaxID=156174 RepID=A0A7S3AEU7_9EUKA
MPDGICSTTSSQFAPLTTCTVPLSRAPFRGQSEPPTRGPPKGDGRQFTPVQLPVETAHMNSCRPPPVAVGFIGQASSWFEEGFAACARLGHSSIATKARRVVGWMSELRTHEGQFEEK